MKSTTKGDVETNQSRMLYVSATFAVTWVGRKHVLIPTYHVVGLLKMI
jgi:hypothetical protein